MHMTNGASFNLTNKKHMNNFENHSNGEGNQYNNQVFVGQSSGLSDASHSGLNLKNGKNVLSGPLHNKVKPIGSSHMEQREKKMKDAYKNAKPKSKGVGGIGGFNNQAVLQYSQNNFI